MLLYKIFFCQKLIILIDVSEIEVSLEKGKNTGYAYFSYMLLTAVFQL